MFFDTEDDESGNVPHDGICGWFHLDFPLRWEVASCPVERGTPATDPEGETMPAGKLLAWKPYGPRGITGSQGAVGFLERTAPGDEAQWLF